MTTSLKDRNGKSKCDCFFKKILASKFSQSAAC